MLPFPILIVAAIIVLYLVNSIKILKEYERGVVFRLGRVRHDATGPGVVLVFRPLDQMVRVSLRQEAMEVPSQDIITRDNVTLKVNAVITLRVVDPVRAVIEVSNYVYQTSQFAQTTLRSVLGEVELDELLAHRERLNQRIQTIIDGHTAPFGVKVVSVEVKQVDMPESMLRAMAKQAEAERERRSKIIHAEGEYNAAGKLVEAAQLMATQPMTLQLRYLQTLTEIGVEKNTTIVFPLPMELMNLLNRTFQPGESPATAPVDTVPAADRVVPGTGFNSGSNAAATREMEDANSMSTTHTERDSTQRSYDEEDDQEDYSMPHRYADAHSAGSDREISLGTGTILAVFFALVLVCSVFFGFGLYHRPQIGRPIYHRRIDRPATLSVGCLQVLQTRTRRPCGGGQSRCCVPGRRRREHYDLPHDRSPPNNIRRGELHEISDARGCRLIEKAV